MRAVVPFRTRRDIGVIVGQAEPTPGITPKRVAALPDDTPVVSAEMLALCEWMAEYYAVPLGLTIRSVLPAALSSESAPEPARRTRRVATVARELPSLIERDELFARAKQQRALYELLESLGGRVPVEHLVERLSFSPSVLQGLVKRGLVAVEDEIVARDPFGWRPVPPPTQHAPSPAQRAALEALGAAK